MHENWVKEYVEKLNRGTKESMLAAYKLKIEHLPLSLYKYRVLNERTLEVLSKGELWKSFPKDNNDPFDSSTTIKEQVNLMNSLEGLTSWAPDLMRKITDIDAGLKNLRGFNSNLPKPQNIQSIDIDTMKSFPQGEEMISLLNQMNSLQRSIQKDFDNAEKTLSAVNEDMKDMIDQFHFTKELLVKNDEIVLFNEAANKLKRAVRDTVKICCFSTTCLSIPMWAYYGDSQKGICIEYGYDDFPIEDRAFIHPVIYSNEVRSISLIENQATTKDDLQTYSEFYVSGLFKSLDNWKSENEWRYLDPAPTSNVLETPKPKAILIGALFERNPTELKDRLLSFARSKNIPVFKIGLSDTDYSLNKISY